MQYHGVVIGEMAVGDLPCLFCVVNDSVQYMLIEL